MAERGWGALTARIAAATPDSRDRGVDALRALAIGCVVLGHWLGTSWELSGERAVISSPLAYLPGLTPVTWVFQMLAVFFLVGGYTAARGRLGAGWVTKRMRRLLVPVVPLLAFWAVMGFGLLTLYGQTYGTARHLVMPALGPLWFLAVFAALTACTPLLVRRGYGVAVLAFCLVAAVDVWRFALDGPAWVGWVNLLAGWLVPYQLGVAWARGDLRRGTCAAMVAGGLAGALALVAWGGYPASMVGVTGARLSNLSPPSLAAACLAVAQAGLAMLVKDRLGRLMRAATLWAVVALANLQAMWIFLWHQTALVLVAIAFQLYGRPDSGVWIAQRLAWLPVVAGTLALMTWCRHQFDVRARRL
ncbi:acyltransferase [Nonomuraea sp. NBC_01738]|uniref:acyltransferase family protein n=1 Tax=Nonomuraea sp. NBC_01738 TaxID=2976003 RepID=UPI002E0D1B8A|nr:acyltransferase [Nonomuraea sp. NBC_01738]